MQCFVEYHVSTSWPWVDQRPTDTKSLLALRGVGPESEAESVRFRGRRVTKVGPEVKQESVKKSGVGDRCRLEDVCLDTFLPIDSVTAVHDGAVCFGRLEVGCF